MPPRHLLPWWSRRNPTTPASLSRSPLTCLSPSRGNPNPRSDRCRRSPPSRLPSSPATGDRSKAASLTASPSCASPPVESGRGALYLDHGRRSLPPPAAAPSTAAPPSVLPSPRRPRHGLAGEPLVLPDHLSVPFGPHSFEPPNAAVLRRPAVIPAVLR